MKIRSNRTDQLIQLAAQLAAHLTDITGHTWQHQQTHDYAYGEPIVCPAEDNLMLIVTGLDTGDGPATRFEISLAWQGLHNFLPYRDNRGTTSITVSATKRPAVIAREIHRRLLPDARATWALMVERKRRTDADEQRKEENKAAIARVLGKHAIYHDSASYSAEHQKWYARIEMRSGDSIMIKIDGLDQDTALAVLQLLQAADVRPAVEDRPY